MDGIPTTSGESFLENLPSKNLKVGVTEWDTIGTMLRGQAHSPAQARAGVHAETGGVFGLHRFLECSCSAYIYDYGQCVYYFACGLECLIFFSSHCMFTTQSQTQ